ncbi:MAG: zinc ribbon domain-containing protein [Xanthomonadaceae bacterium]|nr:zinc ribbon domain-containing protein [Xanthomonadaceae bacterium]MDP2184440.1 zinc ribbon domain-containing protein [Xanthomonadales bacterium]MDZ4116943.1 zinc ribbon domain-containing protein [Xanthomonadaceae bacterium]MDZ4378643.1 zinc ribbon domain-containing protein [Xanthomonadaceae bacterium]
MPIYAFACNTCGHTFERLQKLSDADPVNCPACAALTVQRQLTAPQFRLSGSGWYETDFKKDGETKRNLVDKSEGVVAADAPTQGKSDAKVASPDAAPAAKAESKPSPSSSDGA